MSAETQLLQLYERWRLLSRAEAEAIQGRDWTCLVKRQTEKKALMAEIAGFETESLSKAGSLSPQHPGAKKLCAILAELISLESENAQALESKRQLLKQEQMALHQAARNLHQMQRAYAPGPLPAWHSYS
jgi:hypothetical protein